MSKLVRWLLGTGLLLILLVGGAVLFLHGRADNMRAGPVPVYQVSFPIPTPLVAAVIDSLGLDPEQADSVALERPRERGEHLARARYACRDCHGTDFGGGTMAEAGPVGSFYGPHLTAGAGSRIEAFTPSDWDAIVGHGVMVDGSQAIMPAIDFHRMSDQELSDLIVYIRSLPPVDRTMPPTTLGPLGKILLATGQVELRRLPSGRDGGSPPRRDGDPRAHAHALTDLREHDRDRTPGDMTPPQFASTGPGSRELKAPGLLGPEC